MLGDSSEIFLITENQTFTRGQAFSRAPNPASAWSALGIENPLPLVGRGQGEGGHSAASVISTSGSTGSPKQALITPSQHFANGKAVVQHLSFGPGYRWLLTLPLDRISGLSIVMRALLSGGAICKPNDPRQLKKALHDFKPTHLSLVPTQLFRLLQDNEAVSLMREAAAIVVGGAPLALRLRHQAMAEGLRVFESYAMTEMASTISLDGEILPNRELIVADDGEILVKGPMLFEGYLGTQGEIDPTRDPDGFFYTRDLGRLNQGRLQIIGRKDNQMISGGLKIHPEEIEAEILQYPNTLQAIAVPIESPEFGQRPVAFIEILGDFDESALKRFLADRIPKYKIPDRLFRLPDQEPTKKHSRNQLSKLAQTILS